MRGLSTPYKLLWIYILQDCNHAGIWEVDFETAQLKIGSKITKETAMKNFAGKIFEISGGEKWFIPDFISFQYGQLSMSNRAHIGIIQLLKKYDLLNEDLSISVLIKGHPSPLQAPTQGAKDMDMDKEQEKEMEMDKEKGAPEIFEKPQLKILKPELTFPYVSEKFMATWNILSHEKKWRGKSVNALQAALKKLGNYPEDEAIAMMEASIAGEWQGIFEIKESTKSKIQNATGAKRHAWSDQLDELRSKFSAAQ